MHALLKISALTIHLLALAATAEAGFFDRNPAGSTTAGAAGGANSVGTDSSLERCAAPMGTVAIAYRGDNSWRSRLSREAGIADVRPILSALAQKSNCFVVSTAGNEVQEDMVDEILDKERTSGETRAGSRLHKGQVAAVDLVLFPSITFPEANTGGVGGAACSSLSGLARMACTAAGVGRKSATVNLALIDKRARIQVATAEGSASGFNWKTIAGGAGNEFGAVLAGYTQTPEGRTTVDAFANAHNNLVLALRNYRAQEVAGGLGRGGTLQVQGSR